MMMNGTHFKYALARQLKRRYLNDNGQGFNQVNSACDDLNQRHFKRDGTDSNGAS